MWIALPCINKFAVATVTRNCSTTYGAYHVCVLVGKISVQKFVEMSLATNTHIVLSCFLDTGTPWQQNCSTRMIVHAPTVGFVTEC